MFDDDLFNYYGGTSTETEQQQAQQTQVSDDQNQYGTSTAYNPYAGTSSYDSDYDDDYSVTPNYTEQKSYQPTSTSTSFTANSDTQDDVKRYRKMDMPVVEKGQEVVSLTKTKQRIQLQPRMKIAIAMFAVIMFSLAFVAIWNFVSINNLNSMIADKQATVRVLNASITGLESEYNLLGDEEQLRELAENAGFVDSDESNTYYVSSGNFYAEDTTEALPSNWFNDLCEFFSNLFK